MKKYILKLIASRLIFYSTIISIFLQINLNFFFLCAEIGLEIVCSIREKIFGRSRRARITVITVPNFHISIYDVLERVKWVEGCVRRSCALHRSLCLLSHGCHHWVANIWEFLRWHAHFWILFALPLIRATVLKPIFALLLPPHLNESGLVVLMSPQIQLIHTWEIHLLFFLCQWLLNLITLLLNSLLDLRQIFLSFVHLFF
mgnify:FL=1